MQKDLGHTGPEKYLSPSSSNASLSLQFLSQTSLLTLDESRLTV